MKPDSSLIDNRASGGTTRIRAIVSDLGQVILPFDVNRAWQALEPHLGMDNGAARRHVSEVHRELGFGRGNASAAEFHRHLVRRTGLRLGLEAFRVAYSDMFWVDEETVELIAAAPVQHRILLSNTNELHWSWITENYGSVLGHFDRLLTSHECRCEKPEAEIYRLAMAATGLPAGEHLFIDDIEENILGARAVGMDAVLHTDAAALRREFERRGLASQRALGSAGSRTRA